MNDYEKRSYSFGGLFHSFKTSSVLIILLSYIGFYFTLLPKLSRVLSPRTGTIVYQCPLYSTPSKLDEFRIVHRGLFCSPSLDGGCPCDGRSFQCEGVPSTFHILPDQFSLSWLVSFPNGKLTVTSACFSIGAWVALTLGTCRCFSDRRVTKKIYNISCTITDRVGMSVFQSCIFNRMDICYKNSTYQ